jgi:two-component system response regulator HydG
MKEPKEPGVLVIEDDQFVLRYTAATIAALGYQKVRTASSAADARVLLFAQRFELVICDICLPDGDGRQLVREVFALNPNARVILISAFLYQAMMIPADLYGKVELLEKPFTPEDLHQLLGHLSGARVAVKG